MSDKSQANVHTAMGTATVETFLTILRGRLTRHDEKEQAKRPNNYRLSLLFAAADRVEKSTLKYAKRNDVEALEALKEALNMSFNVSGLPPVRAVVKMIDEFLVSGKMPKYGHQLGEA